MIIYHFTNSSISEFKHTKATKSYSQATGKGIYFTSDYNKGLLKYGRNNKYCYMCEFTGTNIMNLGEFDSAYFNGSLVHSSSIISENFKRYMQGLQEIKEPDIIIEKISTKAFNWLKKNRVQAITGMYCTGYACPEFCVIDSSCIVIKDVKYLGV